MADARTVSSGERRQPSVAAIVTANTDLTSGFVREPASECWACGFRVEGPLTRAHVIARTHGGSDDPENFFLLCNHCHESQPDGASREEQIRWLHSAPKLNEWVDGLIARVIADAQRLEPSITNAQVADWMLDPRAIESVQRGYASAAGAANAHANVSASIAASWREVFLRPAVERVPQLSLFGDTR